MARCAWFGARLNALTNDAQLCRRRRCRERPHDAQACANLRDACRKSHIMYTLWARCVIRTTVLRFMHLRSALGRARAAALGCFWCSSRRNAHGFRRGYRVRPFRRHRHGGGEIVVSAGPMQGNTHTHTNIPPHSEKGSKTRNLWHKNQIAHLC